MGRGGSAAFLVKKSSDGTLPTEDVSLKSGSKILWSRYDSNRKEVPVVCGCQSHIGRSERWVNAKSVQRMMRDPNWSGYCQQCGIDIAKFEGKYRKERRSGKVDLEDGYINFDARDDKGRPLIHCNICGKDRHRSPYGPNGEFQSGRCRKCAKLKTEEFRHNSGAYVYRWKRHPDNASLVAFTCSNPDCCPNCGKEHFAWDHRVKDETWLGRCSDCFQVLPHPRRKTGQEPVGCLDATLDWDDRDDNDKPAITCPLSWCGEKWYADKSTLNKGKANPKWLACCPKHYHGNSGPILFLLKDAIVQPKPEHESKKSESAPKNVIRKNAFNGPAYLARAEAIIYGLCEEGKRRKEITPKTLAPLLGHRGPHGAEQVRQNLKKAGVSVTPQTYIHDVIDKWLVRQGSQKALAMPA